MVFLEHCISTDAKVAMWQQRLNGFQRLFAGGFTLTLHVAEVLTTQPFSGMEIDRFYMDETPKKHG